MDNLVCEESLLLSPFSPEPLPNFRHGTYDGNVGAMSPATNVVTVDEAISMDLGKELRFSNHGDKFMEFFVSKKLTDARFQAVRWLIQTRSRLNLSFGAVFSAASCFDRFVYVTSCDEWTNWMVELVAVTSLSIASKFNEVTTPSLHELQMEGLNHMFHHKTVLEMELIMLKALEWRVNAVTVYSFSETLVSKVGMGGDHMMMHQITNHLLNDICDLKMLQYPPTVVAVAALWDVLDQEKIVREDKLGRVMILFGQEHKEKIVQCVDVMKSRNNDHWSSRRNDCEVKSVLSLLQRGKMINMNDVYDVKDLCAIFQILRSEGSDKKRERENLQDNIRPAKRMTIFMSN